MITAFLLLVACCITLFSPWYTLTGGLLSLLLFKKRKSFRRFLLETLCWPLYLVLWLAK